MAVMITEQDEALNLVMLLMNLIQLGQSVMIATTWTVSTVDGAVPAQ